MARWASTTPQRSGTAFALTKDMQIDQFMTRNVVVCAPEDSLEQAARLLWDHDIGAVVVQDAERRLVGIVTDRDICMAAYTRGLPLAHMLVSSAMASDVHTCRPTATCVDVEAVMATHQVRRVPIVAGADRLVGIVTLNDLARAARSAPSASINQRAVESTLSAISMPRITSPSNDEDRA